MYMKSVKYLFASAAIAVAACTQTPEERIKAFEEAHNSMFRQAFNRIQDSGSQEDWGVTADSRVYFDLSTPGNNPFTPGDKPPAFDFRKK